MTLNEAKNLKTGQTIYHAVKKNADGKTAMRARVTSVKTWKTRPNEVIVAVKRGLYEYATFTENELHLLCLTEPK